MARRKFPLVKNKYYHILNRTIEGISLFPHESYCYRFLLLLRYYKYEHLPYRFSTFMALNEKYKKDFWVAIKKESVLVNILAYCCMRNHFHLLLLQKTDNGISKFISRVSNSYVKYLNNKLDRKGPLFEGRFKSVLVETEEQLLHLSRYIHLNPYSAQIVDNKKDLINYPYSSLREYVSGNGKISDTGLILDCFLNRNAYKQFVLDQRDYQRSLQTLKELAL